MNRTLNNGLELLMLLANAPYPHRISELAQAMELPKSHVHRLLQTLVDKRYVEQDHHRRYAIGVGALRLGHALLQDIPLRRLGLPGLRQLVDKTGWAASLIAPFGSETISIAHVSTDGKIRPSSESLGKILSTYASASGKLFLAHASHNEREAVLSGLTFESKGPNTHAHVTSLCEDLDDIIKRGYSFNNQENGVETYSLAVPIFNDHSTLIGALGLSNHLPRPPSEIERQRLAAELRREADQLAIALNLHQQEDHACPTPLLS